MKRFLLVLGGVILFAGLPLAADDAKKLDLAKLPAAAKGKIDFSKDIQPILASRCVRCHGPEKQKGGLRLDHGSLILKGGNAGTVVKPKDALHSPLLIAVSGLDEELRMPPSGKMLAPADVGKLRAWIEQGAVVPKDEGPIVTRRKSDHWAFQPVQDVALPKVKNKAWMRNEIDAFVLARLEKEGIAPAAEADRATLLRRLSLDLLGLPPTPEQVKAFLADKRPDAYERLVDELLASPHYGERWARHWLDAARYADSDGYEKDTGRPFAWRYREWVINALNRDLPFDQFTIEQLAGDLLPDATLEQKVATGFHRNTLTNREGGVDREQFRVEAVVDRVSTTAKVFLGVTLNCSQCHDHKFDPFSQREFYQFFAFFNSDNEVDIPAPLPGKVDEFEKKQAAYNQQLAGLQQQVAERRKALPALQETWEKGLKPAQVQKLPANLRVILTLEPGKRNPKQTKALADHFAKQDKELARLTKAVADFRKKTPAGVKAQTLALGNTRPTHVMIRGDFLRKGVEVQPVTPGVLPPFKAADPKKPTRLDLARWIVDPANPLTPRVTANWAWQKFFGRGIVSTLEDFGTRGEKPTHPELLDHLARTLIKNKWSLKKLHRYIVSSAAYRQTSKARPALEERDPYNELLARQRRTRLEAEIIRDSALTASGLLSRKVGGPSVKPPQPKGISELTYAGSARWVVSKGEDRYRRGLYTWFQRTSPYPMLMTFDAPDSNVCIVRRERSNTPLQALTLLNDTVFVECAQALGKRIVEDRPDAEPAERVRHGFVLCLGREPNKQELEVLANLHAEFLKLCQSNPDEAAKLLGEVKSSQATPAELAAWVALGRTLLNLDEFVTRE